MKSPRTLLNELEETGCLLASVSGIKGSQLIFAPEPAVNLALARRLRAFPWPLPELKETMLALASRIERRGYAAAGGLIGIDANGQFMNSAGQLVSTPESIQAAQAFYNKK